MSETLSGGELESIWPEAEVRDEAIIDRNSILWRYGGDWRTGLTGLSAGVLQLMHPEVAAGVRQHSEFFNKPWERIFRSWPQIIGGVFDPDAEATAREIRDLHKDVKGTDEQGRNYHAFHPETFYWTHATFHNMIEDMIDKFTTHTMTAAERRQLYAQTTTWFERYDISTRVVPPSYDDFRQKWGFVCNNVLEMTPEAERAIGLAIDGRVNRLPIFDYLPMFSSTAWHLSRPLVSDFVKLLAIGGLPEDVRERFSIPWSQWIDEPRYEMIQRVARNGWRFVPPPMRYHPRARAGNRYAKNQTTSLVYNVELRYRSPTPQESDQIHTV